MKSQKHVFWQALLVAAFIFTAGILLGFAFESSRFSRIEELYIESELDSLDMKMVGDALPLVEDCELTEKVNIDFADKIYEEALLLEELESAQRFTDSLKLQHRKYDLLRAGLWLNLIKGKEKCDFSYSSVVYLYNHNPDKLERKAEQKVISDFLLELKRSNPEEVLLIPIAVNMDLMSVDLLVDKYNITSFPAVVVDEENKFYGSDNLDGVKNHIE